MANQQEVRSEDRAKSGIFSPKISEITFIGRNMYSLKNGCILPKRRGIVILQEFQSDVESVAACNGLFYQNEYGIRKLNLVWLKNSSEVSDIKWLSTPAHVILPSSIASFWHFMHSLIPAFEFVLKGAGALKQTTYYFLENGVRAGSDSCGGEKVYSDSFIIPTHLNSFKHNYSTVGIYDFFTSPFDKNINVEELEEMQCHKEVIIGSPLVLQISSQEWIKILQKKKSKMRQKTPQYFSKDFFSIPVENGYQKEYVTALKKKYGITECTCLERKKPLLLLIRRKYTRRLVNEEEIEHVARVEFEENYETKSVFLESLSFAEQLQLFSCASVAIGASGTGMTWIIFMREGSSVILFQNHGKTQTELFEKGIRIGQGGIFTPTYGTYTNFAQRGNLDVQVWQPRSEVRGDWKNSDIRIDTNDFRLMLSHTLQRAHEKLFDGTCVG